MATINNNTNRFTDIIHSATILYDSTFTKISTVTFNYGITTNNSFLDLFLIDAVRHTGGTKGTITDD